MALASLFQQLKTLGMGPRLDLRGLTVDHGHRPDSGEEAGLVAAWLGNLGY
jgi:hypothetical protein